MLELSLLSYTFIRIMVVKCNSLVVVTLIIAWVFIQHRFYLHCIDYNEY